MTEIVTAEMQQRRGTAAAWTAANPVLLDGEIGVEKDTRNIKIGDGVTAWNALAYAVQPTAYVPVNGANGFSQLVRSDTTAALLGLRIIKLDPANIGVPGVQFEVSTVSQKWFIGTDYQNTDFVLLNDPAQGDLLRFSPGPLGILGPAIGTPAGSGWRFQIWSGGAGDTVANNGLLAFQTFAGYTGGDHVRGINAGSATWSITKTGQMGLGTPFQGLSTHATLEVQLGIWVESNDTSLGASVTLQDTAVGGAEFSMESVGGLWQLVDQGTGNGPIKVQKGSANNVILIENNWLGLGYNGSTPVGFFGSLGTTRPTITGSKGANAALTSLLTALANLGLVTDSTT